MDTNKDDVLTGDEFEDSKLFKILKSFETLKLNIDGGVNRDEFIKIFVNAHKSKSGGA